MKCVKCGYVFDEGMFCPECGAKYDEEEAERIEAEQREAEKKRKEEEEIRKEALKRKDEEKKVQDEIRRQEEKEKRELELEKAKVEQEKLAVERAAHEAELARQQNERARIEQENRVRMEEQERKHQEELARSFNGVLYNTIEERNAAESKYNEQVAIEKKFKKANSLAVWSFVLSIATYPLIMTMILWFPSIILSIVFGVMALKEKTTKKGLAIAGLIVNGLFFLICVLGMILSFGIGAEESSDESAQISSEESVAITDEVQEEKEEVRKELTIVDEAENQQDIQDISLDPVESEAYLVRLNNEIEEYDSAYIGDEWNYDESNQMSGMLYDERGFDLIINFPFQNTKETKKLIDFYEEILKATDSEFVNVEYGRKGLLDGSKQYKQTLDSTTYKYYGGMKNGLPNGKGIVVEYISNYGVYLPKVLGNFKKGQLDGYAINFSVEPIFQVISEGNYKKGEENGEYVIYSSKLLNYELGIDIDVEVIDQYQSYIRERKYATNSMETILIDVPLTPVYIFGTGKLKNGEMTGNWISYYVNGNIKSEIKMNGNEGKGTFYNMDGSVEYKGKFKNGEIDS